MIDRAPGNAQDAATARGAGRPALPVPWEYGADHPYRVLIEQMSEGGATLGADGTIKYGTRRLAALLRTTPGALSGRSLLEFLPIECHPEFIRLFADAGATPLHRDAALAAVDGTTIPVRLSLSATVIEGTRVLCLSAIDLSDRAPVPAESAPLVALVEAASALVGLADRHGRVAYINPAGRALLGLRPDEDITSRHLDEFHPAGIYQFFKDVALPAVAEHGRWEGETVVRTSTGAEFLASQILLAIPGRGGETEFLGTIIRDLTQWRHEEAERHTLAALVEHSSDFIALATLDLDVAYINRAGRAMVGVDDDADAAALGTIWDYVDPALHDEVRRILPRATVDGWQGDMSFRHRRTGEPIPVAFSAFGLRDPVTGQPSYLAAIGHGIADRLRSTEALRASEAHYRLLTEAIPDLLFELDADGRFVGYKSPSPDLLIAPPEVWLGRPYRDVVPPAVADQLARALDAARTGNGSAHFEYEMALPDGPRWFDARLATTPAGHTVIVARDVTNRRRAEEALQRSHDELERRVAERTAKLAEATRAAESANRAKSDFLARMSHEIRTPLNGILGITALAKRATLLPQERAYCEMVHASGQALLSVVNDILDFSKIESEMLDLAPHDFSLGDLLEQATALPAQEARDKGLALTVEIGDGVPDGLVGDAGRLRQILANLLSNAIKFTEHGAVEVRVDAGDQHDGTIALRVSVRDTGIGIPPERQRTIFEPFAQGDPSISRRYGGSGLGLSISARLVALMQGDLRVESEPGQGSTFSFSVPLAPSRVFPARRSTPAGAASHGPPAPAARPLRVLLAEDNDINRFVARAMLEDLGHEVVIARDGGEALATLAREPVDLVLMDVEMPDIDGFAATAAIRREEAGTGRRLPIVALTAHAIKGDRERCLAAGMDGYVSKPIAPADLQRAIDAAVAVESAIDSAAVLSRVNGSRARLRELAALFHAQAPALLRQLHEAADQGDHAAVARTAHTLAGAVGNLGATAALRMARTLEDAAPGPAPDAATLLAPLERELQRFESELSALIEKSH